MKLIYTPPEPHKPIYRTETDETIIATLQRKGYVEAPPDPAPPPPTVEELRNYLAMRRWEEETKGCEATVTNGTITIKTDAESQGKLTGLLVIVSGSPTIEVDWKGADGNFTHITAADVPVMATAVFTHVQTCFVREAQILVLLAEVAEEDREAFRENVIVPFWPT